MSFISVEYFIILFLLVFVIARININKKYLLILLYNFLFSYLFGIETLIFLSIVICYTYICSKLIVKNKTRNDLFIIPIVILLIFFKIANHYSDILVPIGMSFYSLQAISYLVEVRKDNSKFEKDFFLFASAISLFATISSGPIERLDNLIPQLKNKLRHDSEKAQIGLQLICEGLFKKLVIANRIVDFVNKVYESPQNYNGLTILVGVFLYSIQIYCDFSAYSDIAVGSAKLFGIDLTNNFNSPYMSRSIKEFWRNWHISLSTWLKDYIYIPLGGNRVSKIRTKINIIITFIVSGLWHGLNITYLIWGLIHGLLNVININIKNKFVSIVFAFVLVSFTWIFFRSSDLTVALEVFKGIFTRFSLSLASISETILLFTGDITSIPYSLISFIMIIVLIVKECMNGYYPDLYKENIYLFIIVMFLILFGTNGTGSFIYQGF